MSEPPVAPRIVVLDDDETRLALPETFVPATPVPERRRVPLGLAAAIVLLGGFLVLIVVGSVIDQFARAPALGWATLGVAALGGTLAGLAVLREFTALRRLDEVDRLRCRFAEPSTVRAAALEWLARQENVASCRSAVETASSPEEILRLLRNGPVATRQQGAVKLGQTAALEILGLTAAAPSPALDVMLVIWRGWRLVRQVAEVFGLRPGGIASLVLMRRTLAAAAAVGGTNLAVDTAMRAVVSHPWMRHIAGEAAAAGVAARRMVVLARAASVACSPLPPAD